MGKSESVSRQKWNDVSTNDYPVTSFSTALVTGFFFYLLIWNTDKTAVPRLIATCMWEWEDSVVFKSLWTETRTLDKDDITGSWHLGTFHHRHYLDILTTSEVQLKVSFYNSGPTHAKLLLLPVAFWLNLYRLLQTCKSWSCCWRQTCLNVVHCA